jgi:hypothetical protein
MDRLAARSPRRYPGARRDRGGETGALANSSAGGGVARTLSLYMHLRLHRG